MFESKAYCYLMRFNTDLYDVHYFFYLFFQASGLDTLIPGLLIDDYLFEPCGYSMNGLSRGIPVSKNKYLRESIKRMTTFLYFTRLDQVRCPNLS